MGIPEEELVGELLHRALNVAPPIPVGPPAAWMKRVKELRTGPPRIAVAVLNGPRWNELDERLRAVKGARTLLTPSARAWYVMPYANIDMIRTLFSDHPDRIRVCAIMENAS